MSELLWARGVFLSFFAALAVAVWLAPRSYVYQGAPDERRWRDLRVWAFLLVALHAYVYWHF